VAISSGSRSASTVDDVEVEVSADLDGNGRVWWWPVIANSASAVRASRVGERRCEGGSEMEQALLRPGHARDKPPGHVGLR
jgi:hypothetical protein